MSKLLDPFSVPAQLNNLGVLVVAYVATRLNVQTQCQDPSLASFLHFIYYGSTIVTLGTLLLSLLYLCGAIDFCLSRVCPCGEVCLTLNTLGIFLVGTFYHFLATCYGLGVLLFGSSSPCIELEMFKQITGILYAIWFVAIAGFLLYTLYQRRDRRQQTLMHERFISI